MNNQLNFLLPGCDDPAAWFEDNYKSFMHWLETPERLPYHENINMQCFHSTTRVSLDHTNLQEEKARALNRHKKEILLALIFSLPSQGIVTVEDMFGSLEEKPAPTALQGFVHRYNRLPKPSDLCPIETATSWLKQTDWIVPAQPDCITIWTVTYCRTNFKGVKQ